MRRNVLVSPRNRERGVGGRKLTIWSSTCREEHHRRHKLIQARRGFS